MLQGIKHIYPLVCLKAYSKIRCMLTMVNLPGLPS